MKTLSKFILNRNDQVFYYVEKAKKSSDNIHYTVYHDSKHKEIYNQHNFHAIYGTDVKISIRKFAFDAIGILIHGATNDERQEKSYNYLLDMANRLQYFDKTNPKIEPKQLIEALEVYNSVIPKTIESEIDYNEDYLLVEGLLQEPEEREYIKSIEHNNHYKKQDIELTENYENERGIKRVKKYDN